MSDSYATKLEIKVEQASGDVFTLEVPDITEYTHETLTVMFTDFLRGVGYVIPYDFSE